MPETPPVPANDNLFPAADSAVRAVRRAAYIEEVPDYLLSAMFCDLDKLRRSLPKRGGCGLISGASSRPDRLISVPS